MKRGSTRSTEADFWARVAKSGDCWLWTGCTDSAGYGRVTYQQKRWLAHRLAYTLAVRPLPDGRSAILDHLCRTPACCRPTHLEVVDDRENVMRGVGAAPMNAAKTHCKHGHEFIDENTYVARDGSRHCRE